MKKNLFFIVLIFLFAAYGYAKEISVTVHHLKNDGLAESIGVIVVKETTNGLEFQPFLNNMEPGSYKFTINENIGCGSHYTVAGSGIPGMAAGKVVSNLPVLIVDQYGNTNQTVIASDLQLNDIRGRTLVISVPPSTPFDLGGIDDDQRIACGSLELYR